LLDVWFASIVHFKIYLHTWYYFNIMSHLLIIFDTQDNKNMLMFQLLIQLVYLYETQIYQTVMIAGKIGTNSHVHL